MESFHPRYYGRNSNLLPLAVKQKTLPRDRVVINSSYYCKRGDRTDLILIFNADNYVVAEYHQQTGSLKWQRVILSTHKDSIDRWLRVSFPSKIRPAAIAATA